MSVFLPHVAFPGYALGTIAINMSHGWKEDSMLVKRLAAIGLYSSIFNYFCDIASYWSKIATFSYPTSV